LDEGSGAGFKLLDLVTRPVMTSGVVSLLTPEIAQGGHWTPQSSKSRQLIDRLSSGNSTVD